MKKGNLEMDGTTMFVLFVVALAVLAGIILVMRGDLTDTGNTLLESTQNVGFP